MTVRHHVARFVWQMVDAGGAIVSEGTNLMPFSLESRLVSDVQFLDG